jgi:hypothetical protein
MLTESELRGFLQFIQLELANIRVELHRVEVTVEELIAKLKGEQHAGSDTAAGNSGITEQS